MSIGLVLSVAIVGSLALYWYDSALALSLFRTLQAGWRFVLGLVLVLTGVWWLMVIGAFFVVFGLLGFLVEDPASAIRDTLGV